MRMDSRPSGLPWRAPALGRAGQALGFDASGRRLPTSTRPIRGGIAASWSKCTTPALNRVTRTAGSCWTHPSAFAQRLDELPGWAGGQPIYLNRHLRRPDRLRPAGGEIPPPAQRPAGSSCTTTR